MRVKKLYPSLVGTITLLLLIIGILCTPITQAEAITITFSGNSTSSPSVIKETVTKTVTKTITKTITKIIKGNKTVTVVQYTPYTKTEYIGIILLKTTFKKTFTWKGNTFTFKKVFTMTYDAGDVATLAKEYSKAKSFSDMIGGIALMMFIFGIFGAVVFYKRKREVEKWQL